MRYICTFNFLLIVCLLCPASEVWSNDIENSLNAASNLDSILELARKIPVKIRSKIAVLNTKVWGFITFHDKWDFYCDVYRLTYIPREQGFYITYLYHNHNSWELLNYDCRLGNLYSQSFHNKNHGGKYFPLFPDGRYRISDNAREVWASEVSDPWDVILGYVGLNIFDNIDQRKHNYDSMSFHQIEEYPQVIKK